MKPQATGSAVFALCILFMLSGLVMLGLKFAPHAHFVDHVISNISTVVLGLFSVVVVFVLLANYMPSRGSLVEIWRRLNRAETVAYFPLPQVQADPVHATRDTIMQQRLKQKYGVSIIELKTPLSYSVKEATPFASEDAREAFKEYLVDRFLEHHRHGLVEQITPLQIESEPFEGSATRMYLYDILLRVKKELDKVINSTAEFISVRAGALALIVLIRPSIALQEYLLTTKIADWINKVGDDGRFAPLQYHVEDGFGLGAG